MIYDQLPQEQKDMIEKAWKALDEAYKKLWEEEKLKINDKKNTTI